MARCQTFSRPLDVYPALLRAGPACSPICMYYDRAVYLAEVGRETPRALLDSSADASDIGFLSLDRLHMWVGQLLSLIVLFSAPLLLPLLYFHRRGGRKSLWGGRRLQVRSGLSG